MNKLEMNDSQRILIRLMRMAVECEPNEPITLPEREWKAVYMQACQQSLTALIFGAVNRMGGDSGIPKPLLMEWTMKAEAIRGFNAKMNAEAARLTGWFGERGRKTAILKGQANARLYPHPEERQPGDIDIWVEGGRKSVLKLLSDENVMDTKEVVSYHHAHLKKNASGISVEVHFRPSSGNNNPITNRRLQRFLENEIRDSKECHEGFNVPTLRFAMIMQMAHIQRHFLSGGIGLRHIMDYYMLMSNAPNEDRQFVGERLKAFGLRNTAGAVMWLMEKLFSLPTTEMICQSDRRRGRWMLDEAFKSGNFGQYSDSRRKGFWQTVLSGRLRPIRLLGFDYRECLWVNIKFICYFTRTIPKRIKHRRLSLLYFHEE